MGFVVRQVSGITDAKIVELARLLIDCVEGGASVSFMAPLSIEKASAFWHQVADAIARGERALLVAEDSASVIGTVQLILDLPENQPHRADVSKMLVHRRARRQGVGAAMLRATEVLARELGKPHLGQRRQMRIGQMGKRECRHHADPAGRPARGSGAIIPCYPVSVSNVMASGDKRCKDQARCS